MPRTSRRTFLAGSAALPLTAMTKVPADLQSTVAADLDRYIGFGNKQAGGEGDNACGAWLVGELERLGFKIERTEFSAPYFEATRSELVCGESKASVWPQPIVVQTGADGVTGPLVRIDSTGQADAALEGTIAMIELPFGRWSSALSKQIREPITAALAAGAKAAVVITNGPTGKVIALNADGRKPMFEKPVALLAPESAKPFLTAAKKQTPATLIVRGDSGRRTAFNFVGRLDRGEPRWLVVSTPRSGWFVCAGERGPGIATWLWMARWASQSVKNYNLAFVCNSGHEYEYLGAAKSLKTFTPKPADTHLWFHIGANVAARDWHETVGQWRPLPSVDTQRFLSLSPSLLPLAREVFAGHPGLEAPYSSDTFSAGELTEIIGAGYTPAAGIFGVHRYHHVAEDDARCVSAASVAATAAAIQTFVQRLL